MVVGIGFEGFHASGCGRLIYERRSAGVRIDVVDPLRVWVMVVQPAWRWLIYWWFVNHDSELDG